MKTKLVLIATLFSLACNADPSSDPILEDQVKSQFLAEFPDREFQHSQQFDRLTECIVAIWGFNVTDHVFAFHAYLGNTCQDAVPFYWRRDSPGGPLNVFFSTEFGLVDWCPSELEWSGGWMEIPLQPGEIRSLSHSMMFNAVDKSMPSDGTMTIAWPSPNGSAPGSPCRSSNTSHIFKTYPIQLTEEEVEILTQDIK